MILETWMDGLALSVQAGASAHREAPHTDETLSVSPLAGLPDDA